MTPSEADSEPEEEATPKTSKYKGSKSASDSWKLAFETKIMEGLKEASQSCNKTCYLSGSCGLRHNTI
jgi:hypothetical protein